MLPKSRARPPATIRVRTEGECHDHTSRCLGWVRCACRRTAGCIARAEAWGGGGDYDTRLYTALIAGNGPDVAMVKFQNMPRLMEMDAIAPLDA